MRLPAPSPTTLMTTSSMKRNQRLCSLASMRPALASAATMVQPGIDLAASSASSNARVGGSVVVSGAKSGVGSLLQLSELRRATVDAPCALGGARRQHGAERRRIIDVGGDVVNGRNGLARVPVENR